MLLLTIPEFLGHLHPVLVHLPVGILVLALLLYMVAYKDKAGNYQRAITITLLAGTISAILACITGYILSQHEDYDLDLVGWHQWMGIITACTSGILYLLQRRGRFVQLQWLIVLVLFVLVSITGHMGGSLTHGSDYLTRPLAGGDGAGPVSSRKPIPNVQEAAAYAAIIQPLLQDKCYSCHNANKQKGGVRLDDSARMMKGGKEGVVIIAGKAADSKLIKDILLPREDDHHMPPKEKPQLTEHEIALLHWWIDAGVPFNKKVKELPQPENIKPVLLSLQKADSVSNTPPDIPSEPVEKANEAAVQKLKDMGAVILPVAQNSNYLSVNFVSAAHIGNKDMALLLPVKKQLAWLKLASSPIGDSALAIIGECTSLTRLQLDHTLITDAGLSYLKSLNELLYLNLVGTSVTVQGIKKLGSLQKLRSLYLYQTAVTANDYVQLRKLFPKTQIDSGGYVVPTLTTDTSVLKYMPK